MEHDVDYDIEFPVPTQFASEMEKPKYFDICFPLKERTNQYFIRYVDILKTSKTEKDETHVEKHHIVPREWLSFNVDGFCFDNEDQNNIVYLSVRNKILAFQYLVLFFLEVKDSETYRRLTETISRRYHLRWYEFWKNPYIDINAVILLSEKREQELKSRKKKYSDDYLRKCLEILKHEQNEDIAFKRIQNELGFKHTVETLLKNLNSRFGNPKST